MGHLISSSVNDLYINGLREIINEGQLVDPVVDLTSPGYSREVRSSCFIELSPFTLTLTNPRNRIITAKMPDIFNAI